MTACQQDTRLLACWADGCLPNALRVQVPAMGPWVSLLLVATYGWSDFVGKMLPGVVDAGIHAGQWSLLTSAHACTPAI